jgi:hypothetical protein
MVNRAAINLANLTLCTTYIFDNNKIKCSTSTLYFFYNVDTRVSFNYSQINYYFHNNVKVHIPYFFL